MSKQETEPSHLACIYPDTPSLLDSTREPRYHPLVNTEVPVGQPEASGPPLGCEAPPAGQELVLEQAKQPTDEFWSQLKAELEGRKALALRLQAEGLSREQIDHALQLDATRQANAAPPSCRFDPPSTTYIEELQMVEGERLKRELQQQQAPEDSFQQHERMIAPYRRWRSRKLKPEQLERASSQGS